MMANVCALLLQGGDASRQLGPQNGATLFAMRHQKRVPRLGRPADQRKALIRGLVTEVLRHGKITTTKVECSQHCLLALCSCAGEMLCMHCVHRLTYMLYVNLGESQGDPEVHR